MRPPNSGLLRAVRRLDTLNERLEEQRSSTASCPRAASLHILCMKTQIKNRTRASETYVDEVCVVPVDLRAVLVVERHPPEAIVFAQARSVQLVPEQVRVLQDGRNRGSGLRNVR